MDATLRSRRAGSGSSDETSSAVIGLSAAPGPGAKLGGRSNDENVRDSSNSSNVKGASMMFKAEQRLQQLQEEKGADAVAELQAQLAKVDVDVDVANDQEDPRVECLKRETSAPVSPRNTSRRKSLTQKSFASNPKSNNNKSNNDNNNNNNNNSQEEEDEKHAKKEQEQEQEQGQEQEQEQEQDQVAKVGIKAALAYPEPTELALRTHREVVTDVKSFVCAPVPKALGTLQCSLTNFQMPGSGLFAQPVQVWELRITDSRVRYEGVAAFTNVPEATGTGFGSSGPQVADLRSNRLAVVAERRTRGIVHHTTSYLFTMADCQHYHQRVVEKASHYVGKMESENFWGTEFSGFDLSKNLKANRYAIPFKKESLNVRYECSLGNPRQLLVAMPRLASDSEEREAEARDPDSGERHEDSEAEKLSLWQNDIAPIPDMDLGCKVVPTYGQDEKIKRLSVAAAEFDEAACTCFHNRKPIWDDDLQTHILDFGGRVTHPSVKNFQLDQSNTVAQNTFVENTDSPNYESIGSAAAHARPPIVQFGRAAAPPDKPGGISVYSLDMRYPFSPIQAMQLAMSSVENKIVYY